ncbi:hypothetical protein BP5796_02525 [Coleophoma crateriformis]|uniref:Pleckstrin homology domain-containing protein n=1 Tax=Coleophoma crateriformis TaxID=565419 RepID=A0A3D8SYK6_9HELO|nr:hypothetical protein BP5796_02525 [Coleophoma crateriformis]
MATEWETEDEFAAAAQASLPTPTDTPYRTPSRGSRRSSRQKSNSPGPSSSPPPLPTGEVARRGSRDIANDESISILDPRRFTPTLHANLVSEILALRRDQEEKTKVIESLEGALHDMRGEQEVLADELLTTAKESRKQQRQLALLEGGTSSALSELSRERDEAVDAIADFKKRLETAQKKIRSQEEDADRVQKLWTSDKDSWEDEKRKYERKVHVAETRLKTVLEEVAAFEANQQNTDFHPDNEAEQARESVLDNASVRTMSMTNSIRFSMLSGPNGYVAPKLNGISLADELDFDAESEDQTDAEGRESVMSKRHMRNLSRESFIAKAHRRNQSTESLMRAGSLTRGRFLANQAVLERLEGGIVEDDETAPASEVEYVDTGVQFSPPPSPKIAPVEASLPVVDKVDELQSSKAERQVVAESPHRELEVEANQRRKRVQPSSPLIIDAASQTVEDPLSPPRTPKSPTRAPPPPPTNEQPFVREMISSQTQTEPPSPKSPTRAPPPPPAPIPSIQLHPPNSRPASPRSDHAALLPQHSKDAGCQVSIRVAAPSRSVAMQTEEIRVDLRMNMLPRHLHPSAISSNPPSPEPQPQPLFNDDSHFTPLPGNLPPKSPLRRIRSQQSMADEIPSSPPLAPVHTRDAYPGNNDDGPLAAGKTNLRRPHRISSLFAGFDNASSDEAEEFADADMSDNDYRTALSAPRPQSVLSKFNQQRISPSPASVPENKALDEVVKPKMNGKASKQASHADYVFPDSQTQPQRVAMKPIKHFDKPLTLVSTSKPSIMARRALIQSGVAAHQGRQSPGLLDDALVEPPFPIPTRASSRQPPFSVSAPSDGNRSPTPRSNDPSSRGKGHHYRNSSSVRRARSANFPRGGSRYRRHGSRSPPPMSPSTEAPESPGLPPMPHNNVTISRYLQETSSNKYRSHRHQPSSTYTANTVNTSNTLNTTYTGSASAVTNPNNGPTSVVDAIAQTMIGEWMFKYIRRRKSFGVSEPTGGDESANGVRHKRWVWLAPYERAVMWSSKQPTSGSALLGKTGRKLTIQSVLDVKDDNHPPKGSPTCFNRSILILTPARALKFTAVSSERHYVWLTALSFLAHSSQTVPEVVPAPPPALKVPNFEVQPPQISRRRNGIRDSIRVAKGKTATNRAGPNSVNSSQYGGTDNSIREEETFYNDENKPRISESAEPPAVPRFLERGYDRGLDRVAVHGRKRSNTGGTRIPPPISFRGFSAPSTGTISHAPSSSTAGMSVGTTGSSDIYQSQPSSSVAPSGYTGMSVSGRSSIRTSDASARPGAVVNNFFDAVGTVRMEAFISPMAMSRFDDFPDEQDEMKMASAHRKRSRERRRRSRNRDSYYNNKGRLSEDWYGGSKTAGEEEYYPDQAGFGGRDDPFRGF